MTTTTTKPLRFSAVEDWPEPTGGPVGEALTETCSPTPNESTSLAYVRFRARSCPLLPNGISAYQSNGQSLSSARKLTAPVSQPRIACTGTTLRQIR